MKIKEKIPGYAKRLLVLMVIVNIFTYNITPIWTNSMNHYCLETCIDRYVPFVPVFAVIYIIAYIQWFAGYYFVAKTSKSYCAYIFWGEIISKIIICLLFVILPTTMKRAVIEKHDYFSKIVEVIYKIDSPINLFPSVHCLESWICYRSSRDRRFFSKTYEIMMGIMTILVFLSTILIKQHLFVDMVGAVIVAEFGLAVSKHFVTHICNKSK